MDLLHVALPASSEERADGFYVGLLGLTKVGPKAVPAEVCRALFGIARELRAINYTGDAVRFEVFLCPAAPAPAERVEHACLAVEDLPGFLRKCDEAGVEVLRVRKGDALITFIKDPDGHLFEIKGHPGGPPPQ